LKVKTRGERNLELQFRAVEHLLKTTVKHILKEEKKQKGKDLPFLTGAKNGCKEKIG
jgi:hypothetical protein